MPEWFDDPEWFGDFDAFAHARSGRIFKLAYSILRNRQQAEDATQEVLIDVCAKWTRVSTCDRPDAYVTTMVVHECMSMHRKAWFRREAPTAPVDLPDPPAGDEADRVALRVDLIEQLRQLPLQQRTALALRFDGELTDAEIAKLMDISENTVRSHYSKALATLRRRMTSTRGSGS